MEKRNYTSKIIPALKNKFGVKVTDHKAIISMLEEHFKCVFSNHDSGEDPSVFVTNINLSKINEREATELGKPVSFDEVNMVLRGMKHNKSPGSDGFPPEFFKYFWSDLKYFVFRMIT